VVEAGPYLIVDGIFVSDISMMSHCFLDGKQEFGSVNPFTLMRVDKIVHYQELTLSNETYVLVV
jgi:hypothetical protein